ncbi:hypothetical protein JJB99_09035 [Bradyrhizobium diazoefficiens]|uniref:hypothetical protein n=1 Tax=Bradyrhizobium diazoefficiens TaxID=1355477 RepID=UPI001909175F|nr:hypothetical protein [Bradyrhizobium diazoefficiens]QQO16269.1 hypothetical protein JJB99_09035 [Bradyrhizobium diazoefficiens]
MINWHLRLAPTSSGAAVATVTRSSDATMIDGGWIAYAGHQARKKAIKQYLAL